MDDDYYSIESILAENQKIQCTFKVDVPYLDIVSPQNALVNLAEHVEGKLLAAWAEKSS